MAVHDEGSRWRAGRDFRVAAAPSDRPDNASRLTNQNNSVNGAEGDSGQFDDDRELPTPGEVASEFFARYPELAKLPLTRQDGRKIRAELLDRPTEQHQVRPLSERLEEDQMISKGNQPDDWLKGFEVTEELGRNPCTWGRALVALLQDHEENRNTWLHLERGYPDDPGHATFDTKMESRFMASYQNKYYAQMKGWFRETIGIGERPSGESPEGSMDDPVIALVTRTASSIPGGDRLPIVDHFDQLRESWENVYHTLRNTMRSMGLESGTDWQYDRRLEPHDGEGANSCYPHEHIVLVVDDPDLSPSDLRPIVEAHVDGCSAAGPDAHDLGIDDWDANREDVGNVVIRDPEEIDDLAGYVCDYASIKPNDLLERQVEYVAFAAGAWATATRTITRSDPAVQASTADRCKQRFEDGACDQELDHGEEIRRTEIRGSRALVCKCCESPHGIDQSQTLVEARSPSGGSGEIAADGGFDPVENRKDELRDMLGSARAIASSGETRTRLKARRVARSKLTNGSDWTEDALVGYVAANSDVNPEQARTIVREERAGYDRLEADPVAVKRPPKWRLEAVSIDGERHSVNSGGGGVDLETTKLEGEALEEWILRNTPLGDVSGMFKVDRVTVSGARAVASWIGDRAGAHHGAAMQLLEDKVLKIPHSDDTAVPECLRYSNEYPNGHPANWK